MTQSQKKGAIAATGIFALAFAGLLALGSSGCSITDPSCQRSLEETWNVSSDYRGELAWCRGLCSFEGKSFEEVTRTDIGVGARLSCYCCA